MEKSQVNIIEKNIDKLKKFENKVKKKYSGKVLTGFNIVDLKDGTLLWSAYFDYKKPCNECFNIAKSEFDKVNQEDLDPFEYMDMANFSTSLGLSEDK